MPLAGVPASCAGWPGRGRKSLGRRCGQTIEAQLLGLIERHLPGIVERHKPDLALYLAGADPYREDQLGGLGLTIEGLRRRDKTVFEILVDAEVAVAVAPAGGYARRTDDTVEIHCNTVREAKQHQARSN